MLIRRSQFDALGQLALDSFVDEMTAHAVAFSPLLCKALGRQQTRTAVRQAVDRAWARGFTNRGPLRLFVELVLLYGIGFDSDPQYPWAVSALIDDADQMLCAEALYESALDYQAEVPGVGDEETTQAFRRLRSLAAAPLPFASDRVVEGLVETMSAVFPERVAYIGRDALAGIVSTAVEQAAAERFPLPRGSALFVALTMAFGHRCREDPFYPWIGTTLRDPRISEQNVRAERLERKALAWLAAVIEQPREDALR
jgi:hypothetical protein